MKDIFARWEDHITQGIIGLANLFDPDCVVLSASMASFVNFCTSNNLSGAEQFAGLPGSIGGALFMNAGAYKKETKG